MNIKTLEDFLSENSIEFAMIVNKKEDFSGFSSLKNYKAETLTWIRDEKSIVNINLEQTFRTIITSLDFNHELVKFDVLFKVVDPKKTFFQILNHFFASTEDARIISEKATVHDSCKIGTNVTVGDFSFLGPDVIIGANTFIGNHVIILGKVVIGEFCKIQSGTIIGEDGFAYLKDEQGNLQHSPHFGGVNIGNHVSIGANVCIARGAIDDTIIDDYVKIDNLVHIAHNCHIGSNTIIIPGTYIYGSVTIGKNCWISTCCIRDQITIGDNVTVGMGSVVTKSIASGLTVVGNPARPFERG